MRDNPRHYQRRIKSNQRESSSINSSKTASTDLNPQFVIIPSFVNFKKQTTYYNMDRIIPNIFNRQGCNYTIERVRFGVNLDQICGSHNDIPAPLLILILKLNKQAPYKKDVFRAPGHQGNMKKLIHFLQTGRLVNIENFSVHTIASVLKKFLRKLPNGVFGTDCEKCLFDIVDNDNTDETIQQRLNKIHQLILALPPVTQHLLVLLFGTFKAIATTNERVNTGMTSEALGVSVAPSFFQSCVQDGSDVAKMVDVQRFKKATQITKFLIDHFGSSDLFGRENYLYYARISGRVLKIENRYIHWSPTLTSALTTARLQQLYKQQQCYSSPYKWKQHRSSSSSGSRSKILDKDSTTSPSPSIESATENAILDNNNSSAILQNSSSTNFDTATPSRSTTSGMVAANDESNMDLATIVGRHSLILMDSENLREGEPRVMQIRRATTLNKSPQGSQDGSEVRDSSACMFNELREANQYAESTKSLTFLPKVHERQTQRMKTRSEWFLNPNQLQHQKQQQQKSLNLEPIVNHSQRQRDEQQQLELQLKLQLNLERQQEQLNQILQVISSSPLDSPNSVTNRTAMTNQCRPVTFSS